jgi:N-acetylglucosamine kinase-like BadF-type ATPase
MMKYSIGFDGGGTKTECVVVDSAGRIIGEGRGGPSNPLRCGFDAAFGSLRQAANEALNTAGVPTSRISGVCAGLAGAGRKNVVRRVLVFLSQEFSNALAQVTTDLEIALESAVGAGPGVVLIAGTGSAAYGRNAAGETARAGGYGPWVGDEGSAFEIGRRAVAAVARTRDTGGPVTLLTDLIPAALNCQDWDDLMLRIMKNPDDIFPALFSVVAEAADAEDSAAKEILFTSAIGLGNLAMIVVRRLEMMGQQFPVVKCGGVFGHCRMLDALLDSVVVSGALRAKVSRIEISPAVGAARMAARLAASPASASTHHGG